MNFRNRVWFFLVLLGMPFYTDPSDSQKLTIYTEQFPPYNFADNDRIVGINHDIVKRACELAELDCEFKLYPWQRAMALAQSKRFAGLISTSRLPKRERHFQWVGPLVSSPACFYKLSHRKGIHIQDKMQLKQFTVGLHKGDVYEDVLKSWGLQEGVHYINYSEKFAEINAFKRGKLDLFIASANTLQFHINNNRLKAGQVTPAFVINDEKLLGNYLALNLAMPKSIVANLTQAINTLRGKGDFNEIKSRYMVHATNTIAETELELNKRCMH